MEDPKFQVMNTAAKKKVMDILVFTPPAFENRDVQKQVNNLSKMFKSGDPKARGQAQSTIASYEFNEGFSVFKAAEKYIMSPVLDKIAKLQGKKSPGVYEYTFGADKRKSVAYLNHLMKKGVAEKYGLDSRTWMERTLPSIGGVGADLGSMYLLGGAGTASKAISGSLAKVGAAPKAAPWIEKTYKAVFKNATTSFIQGRAGQYLAKEGLVNIFKGGAEGAKDVIRYQLARNMASEDGVKITEARFGDIAGVFGIGAARDFLFASLVSLLVAGGKNIYRVAKGYESIAAGVRQLPAEEIKKLITTEAAGKHIPKTTFARLPEHVQDHLLAQRGVAATADNLEAVVDGSFSKAQFVSWGSLSEDMVKTKAGYRFRRMDKPELTKTFGTIEEANSYIGNSLLDLADKNPTVWTPLNTKFRVAATKNNFLDDVLDPMETIRRRSRLRTGDYVSDATKTDAAAMAKKISKGEYVPLRNRQYGSVDELETGVEQIKKRGGISFRGISDFTPEEMKRFKNGEHIKTEDKVINLAKEGDADSYVFLQNVAPKGEHDTYAALAKKNKGSSTKNEMISAGYDGAFLDLEETQLRVFKEQNIKFVSDNIDPDTGVWKTNAINLGTGKPFGTNKIHDTVFIRQKLISKVGVEGLGGDEVMMSKILSSSFKSGVVEKSGLDDFSRVYLAAKGLAPGDYNLRIEVGGSKAAVKISKEGKDLVLKIPKEVKTANVERVFVASLVDRQLLHQLLHPLRRLLYLSVIL